MSKLTRVVYFLLLLGIVLHPYVINDDILFLKEEHAEALFTSFLLLIAYVFYQFQQKEIKSKEEERKNIEKQLHISTKKLNTAFKYIGEVNRQLPLLQNLTTDLLCKPKDNKNEKKSIFIELLATATKSIIQADWGIFRFVDSENQKTIKEFAYLSKDFGLLKTQIGNTDLCENSSNHEHGVIHSINDDLFFVESSDPKIRIKCFFIFPKGRADIDNNLQVIQSIVDQAQLFYKYLY